MTAPGGVDHGACEQLGVVGAHQAPLGRVHEGDVEQRLVVRALDQLGGAPLRTYRLGDPADRSPGDRMRADELMPQRDQTGGIAADVGDVLEPDRIGPAVELRAQQPDRGITRGDQDRLASGHPLLDERQGPGQELVLASVEERLVVKRAAVGDHSATPMTSLKRTTGWGTF
jgi:hypothetical protein